MSFSSYRTQYTSSLHETRSANLSFSITELSSCYLTNKLCYLQLHKVGLFDPLEALTFSFCSLLTFCSKQDLLAYWDQFLRMLMLFLNVMVIM